MERERFARPPIPPTLAAIMLSALVAGIFAIDTITDLEIAVAVLYVVVILLSARLLRRRGILITTVVCVTATVLSYALTQKGSHDSGLINCGLSLLAIAATSYLSMAAQLAASAEQNARARMAAVARAAAIGELSASIAHEISQPLAALSINGNAALRWLSADPSNPEKSKDALRAIVADAGRAGEIVNRIRSLAGGTTVPRERLAINEIVAEGVALALDGAPGRRTYLRTDFTPDLPPIVGDRVQLTQVVLNLLTNAIEAVSSRPENGREIAIATRRFSADQLAFVVRDNGDGIAPEKLERIFDAFYTTKSTGMGFGLAVSRTFVESHGGRIWAERSTPRGTAFIVSLPVVAPGHLGLATEVAPT